MTGRGLPLTTFGMYGVLNEENLWVYQQTYLRPRWTVYPDQENLC